MALLHLLFNIVKLLLAPEGPAEGSDPSHCQKFLMGSRTMLSTRSSTATSYRATSSSWSSGKVMITRGTHGSLKMTSMHQPRCGNYTGLTQEHPGGLGQWPSNQLYPMLQGCSTLGRGWCQGNPLPRLFLGSALVTTQAYPKGKAEFLSFWLQKWSWSRARAMCRVVCITWLCLRFGLVSEVEQVSLFKSFLWLSWDLKVNLFGLQQDT